MMHCMEIAAAFFVIVQGNSFDARPGQLIDEEKSFIDAAFFLERQAFHETQTAYPDSVCGTVERTTMGNSTS